MRHLRLSLSLQSETTPHSKTLSNQGRESSAVANIGSTPGVGWLDFSLASAWTIPKSWRARRGAR